MIAWDGSVTNTAADAGETRKMNAMSRAAAFSALILSLS